MPSGGLVGGSDAMHATRAAVEEGILPGGGVALLRAAVAQARQNGQRRPEEATICANLAILSRSNGVGVNLFQPIPKPAVNDLPPITSPTEIEKVRPFIL